MKKLLKITVSILLILSMTVGVVHADTVPGAGRYDPVTEGIVSSYYTIDREKGFILGVAPGTTAAHLKNVCVPGNLEIDGETLATGTKITVTVAVPQPEPPVQETEPVETTVPETTVPETTVPETSVPETSIPETSIPETTVPETTVPETTVPETTVPETGVHETSVPETTVPETTVPETGVPETSVPETTVPETTVPETTVPETTVPETTVPETTVPETTVPETSVPETSVPETSVPETSVPETSVPETTGADEQQTVFSLRTANVQPETVTHSLTVIVTGDLNGDANVTITDMLMIKSSILGESLADTAAAAGDLNRDGAVTITDFLKVKSYLLGLETISAGGKAAAADPILLLTPGDSQSWSTGAAAYFSEDTAIASVDTYGTVTASGAYGSTFVYAMDESGNVLHRAIVTVLQEKLTVSLGESSRRIVTGQSITLTPSFNHPVNPAVTWTSSDTSVLTVDASGTLTPQKLGTAVITATLANGSKAEVTMTVAPPIKSMSFDKTLYKVKPGKTIALNLAVDPADCGEEILWSSSDTSIATVNGDGCVTGVGYGTVTITAKGKYSGMTASCSVKVCDVKQVALTFDDGPSKHTIKLLNFLKEKGVKVTFFMVGNRIGSYPNTVKKMAEDGHELGYHSFAHDYQPGLSTEQITGDFNKANDILKSIAGRGFTVWRTPGGGYNDRVLQAVPVPHIYWSVDTLDWKYRNAKTVCEAIMTKSKDGSIVLLHDLHGTMVEGAIDAIEQMLAGDYEFLTVTEILSRDGTPPEAGKNYYNG